MPEAVGITPSSVGHIWADAGLKPHIVRRLKITPHNGYGLTTTTDPTWALAASLPTRN